MPRIIDETQRLFNLIVLGRKYSLIGIDKLSLVLLADKVDKHLDDLIKRIKSQLHKDGFLLVKTKDGYILKRKVK